MSPLLCQLSYPAGRSGPSFYLRRCDRCAFGGESRAEFFLGHLVFPSVATAARGQDVVNEVRASSGKRHAMLRLNWTGCSAVRANAAPPFLQFAPLVRGEASEGRLRPGSVGMVFRAFVFRVRRVIRGPLCVYLGRIAQLSCAFVQPVAFTSEVRIALTPAPHRLARFLGIALHPLACVRTLLLRILVRHASI